MIKSSTSFSLVLPSTIAFIFSSTILSTATAIALSVDLYPSLTLLLLGFFPSGFWVFRHSWSLSFSLSERQWYSGTLWYQSFTPVFRPSPDFDPSDAISTSLSSTFGSDISAAPRLVPAVLFFVLFFPVNGLNGRISTGILCNYVLYGGVFQRTCTYYDRLI